MGKGKVTVIIGDTLNDCKSPEKVEILVSCTFEDFPITCHSSHLCVNFKVLKVVYLRPQFPFVSHFRGMGRIRL